MTQRIIATTTNERITILLDGRFRSISRLSDQGRKLEEAIKREPQDIDEIRLLIDVPAYVAAHTFGRVVIDDREQLRLDGKVVDYGVAPVIKRVISEGFDVEPLIHYVERVAENPDQTVAKGLHPYIQKGNHPLTPDGRILAFKRVSAEHRSFSTGREQVRIWRSGVAGEGEAEVQVGRIEYPMGAVVEMNREDCDPNGAVHCSTGLHVCSFDYLASFHGGEGVILICEVDPADVTSFPQDDAAKMRCCRLKVVGTVDEADARAHFTHAVDRRYQPEVPEPQGPEPDIEVVAEATLTVEERGHASGLEDGRQDALNDYPYDLSVNYPENIEDEDRLDFSNGYCRGYPEGYKAAQQELEAEKADPEDALDGIDDDLLPDDEDSPEEDDAEEEWTIERAKKEGFEDGRAWAEGDTEFDPNPTMGARYDDVKHEDDGRLDLINAYSRAFVGGYTEAFEEAND